MNDNKIIYTTTGTSALLKVDLKDIENVKMLKNEYLHINWVWFIDEDGIIKLGDKTKELKKGDILILFYPAPNELNLDNMIVIRNEDLNKRLEALNRYEEDQDKTTEKCCDCAGSI